MVELKYSQAMPGAYSYQGPVLVELALEGEDHVVGVHLAGRGEPGRGLELHARAQVEGDLGAVLGDLPALGEAGLGLGAALLELDQPVVDRCATRRRRSSPPSTAPDRSPPASPRCSRPASWPAPRRPPAGQRRRGEQRLHQSHDRLPPWMAAVVCPRAPALRFGSPGRGRCAASLWTLEGYVIIQTSRNRASARTRRRWRPHDASRSDRLARLRAAMDAGRPRRRRHRARRPTSTS